MHKRRRVKLLWIGSSLLLIAVAMSLLLFALRQNISLYVTPTELRQHSNDSRVKLRVGGMVVKGSVHHRQHSLFVAFNLTDYHNIVTVNYTGILPALFREGQGIIAEGHIDKNGIFKASSVLAKHDANYHPPKISPTRQHRGSA